MRTLAQVGLRALFLGGLGVVAGLLVNGLRPDSVALGLQESAAACLAPGGFGQALPLVVDAARANTMCSDPTVMIADARDAMSFARGHVAGAVHLPCAVSGHVASTVPALLQGRSTVIVYGNDTADAQAVADGLRRRSQDLTLKVVVLEGGFAAWEKQGLACSSGACPECAEQLHDHSQAAP